MESGLHPIESVEKSKEEILDFLERTGRDSKGITPYFLIDRYRGAYINTYRTPPHILEKALNELGIKVSYEGIPDGRIERWNIEGVGVAHIRYKHY